jgi:hypothetical protein
MNQQAKIIIAALTAVVVALAIGLLASLAMDDDDFGMNGNHSMGMMQAMGNMNSDAMIEHMREVLGEDGYQRMLGHMREHRNGGAMPNGSSVDDMMHRMMDGMMQQMPADRGGNMPMGPR